MDKIFSILDLAVSQISYSFFRNSFYNKSGGGFRENSACTIFTQTCANQRPQYVLDLVVSQIFSKKCLPMLDNFRLSKVKQKQVK